MDTHVDASHVVKKHKQKEMITQSNQRRWTTCLHMSYSSLLSDPLDMGMSTLTPTTTQH